MCQLIGLCFNREVSMHLSFSGFRRRGSDNPDGWGVAWYLDDALNVIKEPIPAHRSRIAESFLNNVAARSAVFVGHVRFSTVGSVDYPNTHPFYRKLNGRTWVFAHNGSVRGLRQPPPEEYIPIGETDSELLFCHLLGWMSLSSVEDPCGINPLSLHQKLLELNNLGTLNALFSDGRTLFAYHDFNGYNSLYYLRRQAPFRQTRLLDEDFSINLGDIKDPTEKGYIVATTPLSDEEWRRLRPGQLLTFSRGEIVFSSSHSTEDETETELIAILRVLRRDPHRVSLSKISEETRIPCERLTALLEQLIRSGWIQQDARDNARWGDPETTFFTVLSKRIEIDQVLNRGRFALH